MGSLLQFAMKAPRSKLRGIKTPKCKTRNSGNEASFGESYPQRLKLEDDTKDIPVLMFSGRCDDTDVARETKQLGAFACLGKPLIPFEAFLSQVKRGLEVGK